MGGCWVNFVHKNNGKILYRLIETCDLISFDVFDTAILRNVLVPGDVFELVGKKMGFDFDFREIREKMEKEAWKSQKSFEKTPELTLRDIYEKMSQYSLPNMPKDKAEKIEAAEIEMERHVCQKNPFIHSIYENCLRKGKQIVFTSDMYLPRSVVREILIQNGYRKFDKLYVSSDVQMTKRTGSLYRMICSDFKIPPGRVLHIGDNYHSDVKRARKAGLKIYHYPKCLDVASADPDFKRFLSHFDQYDLREPMISVWLAIIVNRFFAVRPVEKKDFFYRVGFCYWGLFNIGFAHWLYEQASRQKVEKLFFLSRDGFVPWKVYEIIRKEMELKIPSDYLFASRKAFNFPGVLKMDSVALDFFCEAVPKRRVGFYLERIGLEPRKYERAIRDCGFEGHGQIVRTSDFPTLEKLFLEIKADILKSVQQERKKLYRYFKAMGLFKHKSIAFVDFGWKGSLQKSYENLVGRVWKLHQKVNGFYICVWSKLFPGKRIKDMDGMKGYLLHFGIPRKDKDFILSHTTLFEDMFPAPHGSVVGYEKIEGTVKPLLADYEPRSGKEKESLIAGVTDFALAYRSFLTLLPVQKDLALKPFYKIVRKPTLEEARKIGKHEYGTSFGAYQNSKTVSNFPSVYEALIRPHILLKNFMNSYWKEGYLTQFRLSFFLVFFEKMNGGQIHSFFRKIKIVMNEGLRGRINLREIKKRMNWMGKS